MAGSVRVGALPSLALLLLLLLLLLASIPSLASAGGRRDLLAYGASSRRGSGRGREAGPNCREMASRSECQGHAKWCRWCTSDALDDACFGSAEAWRLPLQVFSCHPNG